MTRVQLMIRNMSVPNPMSPQPQQPHRPTNQGMPPMQPPPGGPPRGPKQPTGGPPNGEPPKKKLWKPIVLIASIVVILVVLVQAIGGGNEDTEAEEATPSVEASETVEATEEAEETEEPEATETEEPEPSEEPEPEPTTFEATDEMTSGGLDRHEIIYYCEDQAAVLAFPYEIEIHSIVGVKQIVVDDDEIRVLWEATLKSDQGGEVSAEVLCVATGDRDNVIIENVEIR